jgi:hypothetical protein
MTDHIHRIRHLAEATTSRWMSKGGMREATREALALLRHDILVCSRGEEEHEEHLRLALQTL